MLIKFDLTHDIAGGVRLTSKINIFAILAITAFMGGMFALTNRSASEISHIGAVMAILNCGVPVNIMLDKIMKIVGVWRGGKNE